jgi:TP901 family phage tail tape measure protein
MSTRSISVLLKANVADFNQQLRSASKSLEELAAKGDKTGKVADTSLGRLAQSAQLQKEAWSTVSTGLLTTSAAAGALVAVAVKKFADFDSAMSEVQADTQETAANMELLRAAAIQAGADTQFSATEAAGAIDELAKAGVSTADILSGGLAGALDLAAAGSLEVSDAASIAATALTQFKLKGSDVSHVADLLAAGAGKAQGGVEDLGMALKQGGLVASQTGLSIEETTGALTAFASAGLIGSDAGTSFKSMLQRLTPQSSEAKALMDQLGISAYDASGNFIGLAQFAGNLQSSLSGLTVEQRNSAMATIFGSDAVRAANVLYEQGQTGIQGWIDKVNDQGYAARVAAQKTDNLRGDVERLGGSLETVFIKSGSGMNDMIRGLVQGLESLVDRFGALPTPVQQSALAALALVAAGTGLTGMAMKVIPQILEMKTALDSLGFSGSKAETVLKGVGKAAGLAGAAVALYGGLVNTLDNKWQEEAQGVSDFNNQLKTTGSIDLSAAFNGVWSGYWHDQARDANEFAETLKAAADPSIGQKFDNWLTGLSGSVDTASLKAQQQFKAIGQTLAEVAATDLPSAQEQFRAMWEEAGGSDEAGRRLLEVMPAYKSALLDAATASGVALDDTNMLAAANGDLQLATEGSTSASQEAADAIQTQADALSDLIDAQKEAADVNMSVDEAQGAWAEQLATNADAVKQLTGYVDENGNAVAGLGTAVTEGGAAWDLYSEAGRLANDTMLDTSKKGWDVIQSMKDQGASNADLRAQMQVTRDSFIQTATQMGMSQQAAEALADEYGLIPDRVVTTVTANDQATSKIVSIRQALANIPSSKTITVYTDHVQLGRIGNGSTGSIFAAGGAVIGPGTGTSDEVPIWGSNGEHMWTAAEVLAAGGQGAVYALRAAVRRDGVAAVRRAMGVGLAGGGAVGGGSVGRVPVSMLAPSVSVAAPSLTGLRIGGTLAMRKDGLVDLIDGRILAADV